MTNSKALSKVFLALACLLSYLAYNPTYAQDLILADPGLDILIQDEAPLLVAPAPAPTTTYSADNPFATSQYTDIADLAELLIKQGYNVDNYFYSEGFTTGIDGTLGNENVCFRDDTNKVYIGRSDVCVDRQMDETYSYIQIDKMDWSSGFPDLTVLQSGDLIGDDYTNWTGCYEYNAGWNGTTGGSCPALQTSGQIIFGYIERTLTNLAAIDLALKDAGIETTGYNYSWNIKNWDTNYKDSGNGRSTADPLQVTVTIKDPNNNTVYSKTYDYSYYISDWTTFSGEEVFNEPINGEQLSELQLSVTGKDLGYWAGHYGPEFREPSIKLNYRTTGATQEDTTIEDTLFNSKCTADPLSDPLCPGYNDAMLAQINSSTPIAEVIETAPNITGVTDPVAEATGVTDPVAEATGVTDPVAEATGVTDPVAEATGTPDPVAEATETITDTASLETTESSNESSGTKAGTSLSSAQLSALSIASSTTNSAISIAGEASTASAGVGLSESGGVSSTLTGNSDTNNGGNDSSESSVSGESNNSGSSNTSGSTDTALENMLTSNDSTNNDLNNGGAVSTEDITGQEALETSQQSEILVAKLNDPTNPINMIINEITSSLIQQAVTDAEEKAEKSSEESLADQNKKEDALVEEAKNGSDDESAKAALLGYNPKIRAYQQPQMPGGDIYADQGVYEDQRTYDNPNARLFNGASDQLHRDMVRQQYER